MSWYRQEFVGALRGKVRPIVRADPRLQEEARRHRPRFWTQYHDITKLRWMVSLVFAALTCIPESSAWIWHFLTAWATLLALLRAGQFQDHWAASARTCLGLPVTSRQVFEEGVSRWLRTSLWLAVDALAIAMVIDWRSPTPFSTPPSPLLIAALVWCSAAATTVIALWWRPLYRYDRLAVGVWSMGFLATVLMNRAGSPVAPMAKSVALALKWATPPGWACQAAAWLVGARPDFPVIAAGLLAFWIALAVPCHRAFKERFWIWEPDAPSPVPAIEESGLAEDGEFDGATLVESRVSEVEDEVLRGEFLQPITSLPDGHLRWIERRIFSRLRDRVPLLDFLAGGHPGWSGTYLFGWKCLLAGTVLAWLSNFWIPGLAVPAIGLTMIVALGCATPLFGGDWPGLRLGYLGNRQLAILALYPVSLREVSRTILTVNVLRCLLAIPCWLMSFILFAYFSTMDWLPTLQIGAGLWLITLLVQPFLFVVKISPGTNDTSCGCLSVLVFISACSVPFLSALASVFVLFSPVAPLWQIAAFFTLALTSFGFEAFYRWLYNTKTFDLMAKR